MKSFIKNHSILTYLLMTFGFAWIIIFILLATYPSDMTNPSIGAILGGLLTGFAPSISAFLITYITKGKIKHSSIDLSFKQKSHLSLYLLSLLIVPLSTLLITFLTHLFIAPYQIKINPTLLILGFTWGIFSAFGEEPGWRGFLLPKFLKKYTIFQSGLLMGIIWGIWHLPMNYIDCRFYGNYMLPFMVVPCIDLILDCLIITALFIKGNGSLKLTMCYHYTLTGCTILQGAIFQPIYASYDNTLSSHYIGFIVKIIIIAILFYTLKNQVKISVKNK